jgi:ubiquinone/menaquinone biosynthesis C-methylase UbiE
MAAAFRVRDLLFPPPKVLQESGLGAGDRVLDYGCGPGSFAIAAAERVGAAGKVYALDKNPQALKTVERKAAEKGLHNVVTILSRYDTGLADGSVDVVLLYDTLHLLENPVEVLRELRRVLKPGGLLSCRDHHMTDEEIVAVVGGNGFRLRERKKRSLIFTTSG